MERTHHNRMDLPPSFIVDLPPDLIIQIISRLPLKSVVQCKLVCKKWCQIITDIQYNFSNTYSKNSPFTKLLFSYVPWNVRTPIIGAIYLVEISENGQDWIGTLIKPRFPIPGLQLYGSCKGLLCFVSHQDHVVHIWNPIFNESDSYITLPQHKAADSCGHHKYADSCEHHEYYVFAYSSAVRKFKVLKLLVHCHHEDNYHNPYKVEGVIITIGEDDVWRPLPDLFDLSWLPDHTTLGVTVNGVFHWISEYTDNNFIHTFDFVKENQGLTSWPYSRNPYQERLSSNHEMLNLLNGQLSMIELVYEPTRRIVIWTMEEYGVEESWTRTYILENCMSYILDEILPNFEELDFEEEIEDVFPAEILKNGDIVLISFQIYVQLVFYDPRAKKVTNEMDIEIEDYDLGWVDFKGMVLYDPCFAPLRQVIDNGQTFLE